MTRARWMMLAALGFGCAETQVLSDGSGGADAGVSPDAAPEASPDGPACSVESELATEVPRPVDVILIADNAPTMEEEILALNTHLPEEFLGRLDSEAVDYRVILLTAHTSASPRGVCVAVDGGPPCAAQQAAPAPPPMTSRVFHYDRAVERDILCRLRGAVDQADAHGHAPLGLKSWLRPEAFKTVVAYSNATASCTFDSGLYSATDEVAAVAAAEQVRTDLSLLSETQFGQPENPNFVWHSFVGLQLNAPVTEPHPPEAALITGTCSAAQDPGLGYQALSRMTSGLRFPVCDGLGASLFLQRLAKEVAQDAERSCRLDLPSAQFRASVGEWTLEITNDEAEVTRLSRVDLDAKCDGVTFLELDDRVELCPQACQLLRGSPEGATRFVADCEVTR